MIRASEKCQGSAARAVASSRRRRLRYTPAAMTTAISLRGSRTSRPSPASAACPAAGVTRSCWSPPHEEARAWLIGRMKDARARAPGSTRPATPSAARTSDGAAPGRLTGSHIDTVPEGGTLDGALGVLAGLECLQTIDEPGRRTRLPARGRRLERRGGPLRQPLRLARASRGQLDAAQIPTWRAVDGERLVDAMARAGLRRARRRPRRGAARARGRLRRAAHRAGPAARGGGHPDRRRRGHRGHPPAPRCIFIGQADHAGDDADGAPQGRLPRRRRLRARARATTSSTRAAAGASPTSASSSRIPGSPTSCPARGELLQEMRELDPRVLARLDRECAPWRARWRARRGLPRRASSRCRAPSPRRARRACMRAVERARRRSGLATQRMPSAAGHDAQNLARVTDAGHAVHPVARAAAATAPTR